MSTPASPIVVNYNGIKHTFPLDATQQEITDTLNRLHPMPSIEPPSSSSQIMDPYGPGGFKPTSYTDTSQAPVQRPSIPNPYSNLAIGSRLANAMPVIGAGIADAAAPFTGGLSLLAAPAGALAGSAIKRGMQTTLPSWFGSIPKDQGMLGDVVDSGIDTVGAGILPKVITKGITSIGSLATQAGRAALIAKWFKNTGPVQKTVGKDIGDSVDAFTNDTFSNKTPSTDYSATPPESANTSGRQESLFENPSNTYPPSQPAGSLSSVASGQPILQTPKVPGSGKSVPSRSVQESLLPSEQPPAPKFGETPVAGDNPSITATRSLLKKGYSPSTGRIDSDGILDEMIKNPDKYKDIDPDMQGRLKEFLTQAKTMQSDKSINTGSLISMKNGAPVLAWPGAIAGGVAGHLTGIPYGGVMGATAGSAGGIYLGEKGISLLMQNPTTAKLVIQAMKTPATAQESSIISKVLLNALRGTEVMATSPKGEKPEKAVVNQQGVPTYPPRQ